VPPPLPSASARLHSRHRWPTRVPMTAVDEEQKEQGHAPAARLSDLAPLLRRLRSDAEGLPPDVRHEVLAIVEKLHAQMGAEKPHAGLVKMYARALETFAELTPVANAILNALSAVGA
jgi:hypothetical protein